MAIGLGRIRFIALAALAGSLVNLPLSYALTRLTGDVSGVIWGTVLTTWVSNLVAPGLYCARVLPIHPGTFLRRSLAAPLAAGAALLAAAWLTRGLVADIGSDPAATRLQRATPLALHLAIGLTAYTAAYLLTPHGRADASALLARLRPRRHNGTQAA
jgi:hypothetical protein